MSAVIVVLVAAVARNGVIGANGDLPWRLSSDLLRFKAQTFGKPVIMGRKTYDSIGRPLPGRLNIVVSRSGAVAGDVRVVENLEDGMVMARQWAKENGADEICVIGGGKIYREMIGQAQRLYLTHVDAEPEGDTLFPKIDEKVWCAISSTNVPAGENDDFSTRFCIYERIVQSR